MVWKRNISTTGVPLFWKSAKDKPKVVKSLAEDRQLLYLTPLPPLTGQIMIKYNVLFLERIHSIKIVKDSRVRTWDTVGLVRNWCD